MIFEFIFAFIMYVAVVMAAYYATEVYVLPKWLRFPPFNCRKCLTFWSNLGVFISIGLSFGLYWFLGTGIVLAIFTAIAMTVEQRNKTIKISDFE